MENSSPARHWLGGKDQAWGFTHWEEQTLAESANKQLSGRSVTSITIVSPATGYPGGLVGVGVPLFVLANRQDRSAIFMYSDLKNSFQFSQL